MGFSGEEKGVVHSDIEVHHLILAAFQDKVTYMIVLADLDSPKGEPSEHEALRGAGVFLDADGEFAPPEMIKKVGIGTRVKMIFKDVCEEFTLHYWTIDEEADQLDPLRR